MALLNQNQDAGPNARVDLANSDMPISGRGERPADYADRVGEWYVAKRSDKQRKENGLFLTPVDVADFMAGRITARAETIRVLDPAAGAGVLCCAAVEALTLQRAKPVTVEVVAYEVDPELAKPLEAVLDHLSEWCAKHHGVSVIVRIEVADFILANAPALKSPGLFSGHAATNRFDVVIANPPYFKIGKDDPRAVAASMVVHGQPNIYALFMAVGAAMLRKPGDFVFITPRSFASGPYFRRFRDVFFSMIRPTTVHVFDSRRSAFRRDTVLQENVIVAGRRENGWCANGAGARLTISSSQGVGDIDAPRSREVALSRALNDKSAEMVLRLPACEDEDDVLELVDSWPSSLGEQGLRISTGPVVPFRATEFVAREGRVPSSHAPLLWMNHVRAMQTRWPIERHKPEYIARVGAERLLVPSRNYVLMRRFSAKEEQRRLTAAPYIASEFAAPEIGLENHLNYIHRPGGELSVDETWGLAALYNSHLLDTWFRAVNGNTQVSATELRSMPLPAHEVILSLGQDVRCMGNPIAELDSLVSRMVVPSNGRGVAVG